MNHFQSNQGNKWKGKGKNNVGQFGGGFKPRCQLYGKFGHTVINCYLHFNPFFTRLGNSSQNIVGDGSNAMEGEDHMMRAMVVATSMTSDMSDGAQFPNVGAANHFINDFNNLNIGIDYQGNNKLPCGQWSKFKRSSHQPNLLSLHPYLPKHSILRNPLHVPKHSSTCI